MEIEQKIQKKERYHHGDLRAQLIEAARQLVEEKGPDRFSVSEACRVAGVSTAAPYRHFRDKDEMLLEVKIEGMQRQYDMMMTALLAETPGTPDRIVAMGRSYVGFAVSEPGVFRLIFGLDVELDADPRLEQLGPAKLHIVADEVAKCLGLSEANEDARQRAFMLWTFVHGLSFLLIDGKVADCDPDTDVEALLTEIARRVLA